jgi:hypothetical protein
VETGISGYGRWIGKGGSCALSHLCLHRCRGPLEMYQDHHRASTGMRQWAVALVAEGGKCRKKAEKSKLDFSFFLFFFFFSFFLFFFFF